MLGRWLLLLACPVASLTAQSTRVRVTIGDRLGQEEYQIVTSGRAVVNAVGAIVTVRALGDSLSVETRDRSFLPSSVRQRP